jgi:Tol biopolymer transport system component
MEVARRRLLGSLAIALLCGVIFVLQGAQAAEADPLRVGAIAYARVTEGYWQIWTYDLATGTHTQRTHSHSDKRDPVWRSDGSIAFRSHNNEVFSLPSGGGEAVPYRADLWPAFDPAGAPRDERIALAKMHADVRDSTAIWIVGSKKGDQRVLTTGPGFWTHPDWSSDGKRLVYIRSFGYRGSEIRTIGLDDGAESVLLADPAHNVQPEWSPNDAAIAYASDRSGDYEIYVRGVADGTDRRLTDRAGLDIRPAWSPDGSQIAYASFRAGKFEIWTMAADGSGGARLFAADADASDPAWR